MLADPFRICCLFFEEFKEIQNEWSFKTRLICYRRFLKQFKSLIRANQKEIFKMWEVWVWGVLQHPLGVMILGVCLSLVGVLYFLWLGSCLMSSLCSVWFFPPHPRVISGDLSHLYRTCSLSVSAVFIFNHRYSYFARTTLQIKLCNRSGVPNAGP